MATIGEEGESFNFSSATRAANIDVDSKRINRYDTFQKKYVYIRRGFYIAALLAVAGGVRLWTTEHGIWAVIVVMLALILALGGFMFGQGAGATVYTSGLLIPARISSLEPLQIESIANMSSSEEAEPVYGIRRVTLTELPLHTLRIGERIPCAGAFGGSFQEGHGHYEPRPLAWATGDPATIAACLATISEDEWERLTQLARQLPALTETNTAFYRSDLTLIDVK